MGYYDFEVQGLLNWKAQSPWQNELLTPAENTDPEMSETTHQ